MPKIIAFIASSLDGYIARKNDDVSWLEAYNASGEDYGYSEFMKTVGVAIMGARTYSESLKHPKRLLAGMRTYILSHKRMRVPKGFDVKFHRGSVKALVAKVKRESEKDVWLVGGGKTISSFLDEGLVDELVQFTVPIRLGAGIPLYSASPRETRFSLIEAVPYKTGIVKLRYAPKK